MTPYHHAPKGLVVQLVKQSHRSSEGCGFDSYPDQFQDCWYTSAIGLIMLSSMNYKLFQYLVKDRGCLYLSPFIMPNVIPLSSDLTQVPTYWVN